MGKDTWDGVDIDMTLKSLSRVRLFVTPWTVAYQAPPSMEFSRQEYCSGLPCPSLGDLPNPGIEPGSPFLPCIKCAMLSHSVMSDSVTLWTGVHQAPLSLGILQARILEWIAMPPRPPPGDLPNPEIESRSPTLQVDSLPTETSEKPK